MASRDKHMYKIIFRFVAQQLNFKVKKPKFDKISERFRFIAFENINFYMTLPIKLLNKRTIIHLLLYVYVYQHKLYIYIVLM